MVRTLSLLLMLTFGLFSCSQQNTLQQKIAKLEDQLEKEEQPEIADELRNAYESYVKDYPNDTLMNGRYLYRSAALAYRMQDYSKAIEDIHVALENYHSSDNTLNNATFLGDLYQKDLRKTEVANTIWQAIALTFPEGNPQLPNNIPNVYARLDTMRNQIFDDGSFSINFQLANDYLLSVEEFVRVAPQDPKSSTLLYNAAEIARSIQIYQKAIELFDWLEAKYPGHEKEAQAMFLKAFTLDDGLKDYEGARKAYEAFIEKYPDNPFADDARYSIDNLGKDVNELINEFEQSQEQQD